MSGRPAGRGDVFEKLISTKLKDVARGADGVRPPLDGCGAKACGSPLPLRPKNGFRAQQNTTIPSRGPLERGRAQIKGKRGPLEAWGSLELDGASDEKPMGP